MRLLFVFTLCLWSSHASAFGAKNEAAPATAKEIQEKIDFILKVARNVTSSKNSDVKTYRIGVFGRNDEAKVLYEALSEKQATVNGKKLEVLQFNRIRNLKEVDLIYLHQESKESLKELSENISETCIVVTEDYPYGLSLINFRLMDGKISYELQEQALEKKGLAILSAIKKNTARVVSESLWKKKSEEAEKAILEKEKTISGQRKVIDTKKKQLEQKAVQISSQKDDLLHKSAEIEAKKALIDEQQKVITSVAIGAIVALFLISFLLIINKKRKQALAVSEQKTAEILSSISYAKRIQNSFLPSRELLNSSLKNGFIFYDPKDIVSGDFYWLEEHKGITFFAVADCTGHGVPGALLSALCSTTLSRTVNELGITDPGEILDTSVQLLDEFFSKGDEMVLDGMDIGLCSLSTKDRLLQFSGANRPMLVLRKDGTLEEFKGDRQPIGYYETRSAYTTHKIEMQPGDTLYLFSDGITDQFGGEKGKKFGIRRLKERILATSHLSVDEQKVALELEFKSWRGHLERIDDACFMSVRIS